MTDDITDEEAAKRDPELRPSASDDTRIPASDRTPTEPNDDGEAPAGTPTTDRED